jgi:ATP-binding cassette subfamily B protein
MRDLAGTDRQGTNLLGLLEAAERLGFSAKGAKGPWEALAKVPLPAIAHITTGEGYGHFVVVYRVRGDRVVVADPARGVSRLSREEFCERWTGYLLVVRPAEAAARRPGQAPSSFERLVALVAQNRRLLAETLVCAVLMTVLGIGTSYFVQHLVDSVLVRNERSLLNALGIGMVLIVVFRILFGALRQYLLTHIGRKVDLLLISGYARHLLNLPMKFFETRRVGEILSRVNDASKVRQAVSGTSLSAVVDGMLVVVSLVVLWLHDAPLALVSTLFVPGLLVSVLSHHAPSRRRSLESMERSAELYSHLVEDVSGVETVKAFGAQRQRLAAGEGKLLEVLMASFSLGKIGISMNALGGFVTGIAGVAILWVGGHRVMDGALTTGQLLFFFTMLGYLLGPLERLASVNLQLQDALVAVDRLYQVMDLDVETSTERKVQLREFGGPIELEEVSFRYGSRANVLDRVDLRIPAGSKVAIVGESGSGKSTLLRLLMRFHEPTEGRILVGGVDMRDYDLASLRGRIGLVSQDPFVFNGTVRENIGLGRPDATLEEVIEAARAAGLDRFVADLPDRYDTVIGERGANLSGGQRQRLAIARALLAQPEVLIFDEATSHLDTATEREIQRNLSAAFEGRTVILVAHRLSTIKDADCIYVLRDGRVAERGTHEELLARRGLYRDLWDAQTGSSAPADPGEDGVTFEDLGREFATPNVGVLRHACP